MIDNGLGFQLVPWIPSLERELGRQVSGIAGPGVSAPQSFAVTLAQTAAPPPETSTQQLRRVFEEFEREAKRSNGGE